MELVIDLNNTNETWALEPGHEVSDAEFRQEAALQLGVDPGELEGLEIERVYLIEEKNVQFGSRAWGRAWHASTKGTPGAKPYSRLVVS